MLIQSCDEESPTPVPTLTAPSAITEVKVAAKVDVTFTFAAPGGYATATATAVGGTASVKTPGTDGAVDGTVVVEFTADNSLGAGAVTLSLLDKKDQAATATATINKVTNVAAPTELTGTISANTTLTKGTNYIVKGTYVVASPAVLTVQPGAIIKGDKATKGVIVIKQGAKIMAEGTAAEPIVFTSSQPVGERDRGDWGGIIIMGDAYVNQLAKPAVEGLTAPASDADFFKYGTVDQADATKGINDQNSGSLKYVRIEYAGIELIPNSETNSLTMAGVGSGTTIDYVQASYGGDDGFEWFGGSVSAKHLVSLATWDDDFDTDFGWRGNVQWGLVVRAPFVADQSGSTSFESDSQGNANAIGSVCNGTVATGCTQGVFSNITVFGPRDLSSTNASNATRAISANYTRAMHIRRRTAISLFNSVITGYGAASGIQGLQMEDKGTQDNYAAGVGVFANNVLFFPDPTANAEIGAAGADVVIATVREFWNAAGNANITVKPAAGAFWSAAANDYGTYGLTLANFFGSQSSATYPSNPNFAVASGSLTGQTAATLFANAKLGTFFDKTLTYKGAFGATDWTDGWSEFQPLSKTYSAQ